MYKRLFWVIFFVLIVTFYCSNMFSNAQSFEQTNNHEEYVNIGLQNYLLFNQNGKWGVIYGDKIVIKPLYDNIELKRLDGYYSDGILLIRLNDKWGMVRLNSQDKFDIVIEVIYDKIVPYAFDNHVSKINCKCYKGDKVGIIEVFVNNKESNILFPVIYSDDELNMLCYARGTNYEINNFRYINECFYIKNTPNGIGLYDRNNKILLKPKKKYKDIYLLDERDKYSRIGHGARRLKNVLYYKNDKGEFKPINRFTQNSLIDCVWVLHDWFRILFFPSGPDHVKVF